MNCIQTLSEQEHATQKNVLAGSSEKITQEMLVVNNGKFGKSKITFIPSLFKIIDEAIVNVTDHFICCINKRSIQQRENSKIPDRYLTNFILNFNESNGEVTIANNGFGIPIEKKDGVYIPQLLFTEMRTGTNMKHDPYSTTGGTNGCGACIITMFSSQIILDIQENGKHYVQKIESINHKLNIGEPTIENSNKADYTRISFIPNWKESKYKKLTKATCQLFNNWIEKRLMMTSIYCNIISEACNVPKVQIKFNKEFIDYTLEHFKKLQNLDYTYVIEISPNSALDIGYNNPNVSKMFLLVGINLAGTAKDSIGFSVLNGVEVQTNPFTDYIMNKIFSEVTKNISKDVIQKNIKSSIKNYFSTITIGTLMNIQWNSQLKDSFVANSKLYSKYNINYSQYIPEISQIMKECLLSKSIKKSTRTKNGSLNDIINNSSKYSKAVLLQRGGRIKEPLTLFLAEGDTAKGMLDEGLKHSKDPKLNRQNASVLTIGGVPMNTFNAKWTNSEDFQYVKQTGNKHKSVLTMSESMSENKFIQAFLEIMNIKPNIKYETEKELKTLRYQRIIIATDQDLDGFGINGLLLVFFRLWPAFFHVGMISRLNTPLIRVAQKMKGGKLNKIIRPRCGSIEKVDKFQPGVVYEFMMNADFDEFNEINSIPKSWYIKYYKGLGTTESKFVKYIFNHIDDYILTFKYTPWSDQFINAYYGPDANIRKKCLSKPVRKMIKNEIKNYADNIIHIGTFMDIYVKEYQLDNSSRKLLKLMDGQNNVTGKLLASYFQIFKSDNDYKKVMDIASTTATKMKYHHGETSMCNTIINGGQVFPGKKLLPLILKSGGFGYIEDGGKKTRGKPRYIGAYRNGNILDYMFRKEDEILLEPIIEEESPVEPKFYLPVLPLVILENYTTTSHGWKIEIWGRDIIQIVKEVIYLIRGREPKTNCFLPISEFNNKSKIIYTKYVEPTTDLDETESETELEPETKTESELESELETKTESELELETKTESELESEPEPEPESYSKCYSVAIYDIISNIQYDVLKIHELPISVWPNTYQDKFVEKKQNDKLFDSIVLNVITPLDCVIELHLAKDWKNMIPEMNSNVFPDHEVYLGLRKRLCDEINLIHPNGHIIMYKSYYKVLLDWFEIRKEYYIKRINRQIEILKFKIIYQNNILKYLENFHDYKLGVRGITGAKAHQILDNNDFNRINPTLQNPDYQVPTELIIPAGLYNEQFPNNKYKKHLEKLEYLKRKQIFTGVASYAYLDKIPTSNIRVEHVKVVKEKIQKLEIELETLIKKDIWKNIWESEILELINNIREPLKKRWEDDEN